MREVRADLPTGILAIGGDKVMIVDSKLQKRGDVIGLTGSVGQVYAEETNRQDSGEVIGELQAQSINLHDFL